MLNLQLAALPQYTHFYYLFSYAKFHGIVKIIILSLFSVLLLILLITIFNITKRNETPIPVNTLMQNTESSLDPTYCTFLPYWDFDNAVNEIVNETAINTVSPFVYSLQENLTIKKHLDYKNKLSGLDDEVLVIPTISNDFEAERVSEIINSKENRAEHVDDIVLLSLEDDTDGIIIDYEMLYDTDKDAFSTFIEELAAGLNSQDRLLYVAVHPKRNEKDSWAGSPAQDWTRLGAAADKIIVMAYDYSWAGSDKPGPIAPYFWVKDITEYAKKTLGKKAVLGFGIYGYNWDENEDQAENVTVDEIARIVEANDSEIHFNNNFISPYISYNNDGEHTVWYENEKSIEAKLKLISNYSGYCIWRSGGIPESYYKVFRSSH